ncbi:MAG: hypothetical protein M0Q95_01365 [Porticoccaceae bacterium]|nr:hypothetical protein [Porticoccaceae bacterium]
MDYLLIAFIIAVVLSPLAWLKSSPGQARVTAFRKRAGELGLKVQLVPAPDADEADKRPSAVRYCLLYNTAEKERHRIQGATWILLRDQRRGWDSPWQSWRWFRHSAEEALFSRIEALISAIPASVYGIRSDSFGICLYLRETGDIHQVDDLAAALKAFLALQE